VPERKLMDKTLVKIELGCGSTKTEGYIGIDRFDLPGVDVVTDINKGLPFDDGSVDVILASHSLEHMDDLGIIMNELYRVSKHKTVFLLLAPYYFTSTNIANPYHYLRFTEDTMRFFTQALRTTSNPFPTELDCPHLQNWGLAESDNSDSAVSFETLQIEYFYFDGYRHLSEIQKANARRSLLNVCDQIYCVFAVNKTEHEFSEEECDELREIARQHEPDSIDALRGRDTFQSNAMSLLHDIDISIDEAVSERAELLEGSIDEVSQSVTVLSELAKKNVVSLSKKIRNAQEDIAGIQKDLSGIYGDISGIHGDITGIQGDISGIQGDIRYLQNEVARGKQEQFGLAAVLLEVLRQHEHPTFLKSNKTRFAKKADLFPSISKLYESFTGQFVLASDAVNSKTIFCLSNPLPSAAYLEYRLKGKGNNLNLFLVALLGSQILVEIVSQDSIKCQMALTIENEGPQSIAIGDLEGEIIVRLKTLNNHSIVRVLEAHNRRYFFLAKKTLVAYLNDSASV